MHLCSTFILLLILLLVLSLSCILYEHKSVSIGTFCIFLSYVFCIGTAAARFGLELCAVNTIPYA